VPGKFEGNADEALAERLYDVTMDGGQDDEIGTVDELGWYGLILGFEGKSYVVEQDTYGFFGYTEYDSPEAARTAFGQVESAYAEIEPDVEMQEGAALVENEGPGVPAIVGEAGPEAVIPLDDPAAVEVMADAISEAGADTGANANDATIAAAEAVESAAEAVEVVAVADAVEEVAEAQAEAVEEVAESRAEVAEEAVEAVADVATEEIDERPKPVHGFFR
jgi:hypothetical protein